MAVRRYAEGTTVPVEKTLAEMRTLLSKHGATHFAYGESPKGTSVQFALAGLHYRFDLTQPIPFDLRQEYETDAVKSGISSWTTKARADQINWGTRQEAEWRRRWRARLLWLKAELEFAEGDEGAIATALLAHLVLPDGRTFGTWAAPQIEAAYSGGSMPPLLLGSGE